MKYINEDGEKSFLAHMAKLYLKTIGIKKIFFKKVLSDKDKTNEVVNNIENENYNLPKIGLKSKIENIKVNDMDVYHMSKEDIFDYIILYLHGGAYVTQPLFFHWRFCDKLVQELNAKVIVPIYPKTPKHTWKESYDLLTKLYSDIVKKNNDKKIIIMGDSAGGGLALGFREYLNELKLKQPDKMILFSPWLDITMSNEFMKEYEEIDCSLASEGLIEIGKLWANDLDPSDYKVSPINGKLKNIDNIYLYVGDREIIFPDVEKFYNKLKEKKVNTEMYIGKSLGHDFPLYPIPEAEEAFENICNNIRK